MLLVGADIGGTFTDIVVLSEDGRLRVEKRLSTPEDYSRAVIEGLADLLRREGLGEKVASLSHGTTVATNAILERRGAMAALLTTAGFRDVLEIGRLRTPRLYDITWEKPKPLVPRRRRLEVPERIAADGSVVEPLDLDALAGLIDDLRADGVEAIAICFLNSYVNAAHEQAAKALAQARAPGIELSVSSEVLPEIKEFERTSTTVADAYVKPTMRRYLQSLSERLRAGGFDCPVYIMQSNGGIQDLAATAMRPVYAIESGPAAGVIAARWLGERAGFANAVAFDMGGTTAKASLIEDGRLSYSAEFEVGGEVSRNSRLIKGSGYLLRTPVIDISEVGAGGGSYAWVDRGGSVRVGPEGAGSQPGPACYGRGGERPTVTDANVVLGYINPERIAGGTVPVDVAAARRALAVHVAGPAGLDDAAAAYGVHEIANANMARAVRAVSTERGRDLRAFSLVAFGGSGPIHAASLAREFEMPAVVVPMHPGLFSAFGLLFADVTRHFVHTIPGSRTPLGADPLRAFEKLEAQAREALPGAQASWHADLRYRGQGHELRIEVRRGGEPVEAIAQSFADEHRRQFGHDKPGEPIEVVNLRLVARAPSRSGAVAASPPQPAGPDGARDCYFGPRLGLRRTRVVASRAPLSTRPTAGPLVVEEYDSTIVVPPDFSARLDEAANIWLERTP